MSGPVTEYSYFATKPGLDVFNPDTSEGQALLNAVDTALSQPGATRVYYGAEVENPENVWLFLDWESLEDHMNYRNSDTHGPIIESLKPILDFTRGFIKHITPTPPPPIHPLTSPTTEILTFTFPPSITPSSKHTAVQRLQEFTTNALATCPDFQGVSYGWSVEDDVPARGDEEKSGVMLVAFIGWPSVEAHMRFRETRVFGREIGGLRSIPGLVKLGAFHVRCTRRDASDVE